VTAEAPPNGNLPPDQARARAMDPAAMRAMMPPAQRWMCAVCLSHLKAFEAAHETDLAGAIAKAAASGRRPAEFLDPSLLADVPQVQDAATMVTLPGLGQCYVCPGHVPPAGEPGGRPLLVAHAGLNLAAFAAGMG
jgi:hypothetical protein